MRCSPSWMVFLAGTWAPSAIAEAIPLPPGLDAAPRGTFEAIVYSQSLGELPNPIDRRSIEAQCEMARKVGLTARQPLFEAGYDQPVKTETRRFVARRRWAAYSVRHDYGCDGAAVPTTSTDSLCGCTYRIRARRSLQIRTIEGGHVEDVLVDLDNRRARRRLTGDRSTGTSIHDGADFERLSPEVIGRDTVAGIPCVIRRQRLGDAWIDRCIAEGDAKTSAPGLRHHVLSEVTYRSRGNGIYSWSKAVRITTDASVDAAIFDMPPGIVVSGNVR